MCVELDEVYIMHYARLQKMPYTYPPTITYLQSKSLYVVGYG